MMKNLQNCMNQLRQNSRGGEKYTVVVRHGNISSLLLQLYTTAVVFESKLPTSAYYWGKRPRGTNRPRGTQMIVVSEKGRR